MREYLEQAFKEFNTIMINDLVSISKMDTYKKESILYFEGEQPRRLYCLAKGSLYEYKSERLQRMQAVRYFEPVTLIGELSVITDTPYPVSMKCDEDSTIISIDFDHFMKLFCYDESRGRLGYANLLQSVTDKYDYHLNSCCYSCTQTRHFNAEKRVAKYLYEDLKLFNGSKKWKTAQILRISPETLSRTINKLKRKSLIQTSDTEIIIVDKQKLFDFFS